MILSQASETSAMKRMAKRPMSPPVGGLSLGGRAQRGGLEGAWNAVITYFSYIEQYRAAVPDISWQDSEYDCGSD